MGDIIGNFITYCLMGWAKILGRFKYEYLTDTNKAKVIQKAISFPWGMLCDFEAQNLCLDLIKFNLHTHTIHCGKS